MIKPNECIRCHFTKVILKNLPKNILKNSLIDEYQLYNQKIISKNKKYKTLIKIQFLLSLNLSYQLCIECYTDKLKKE